MIDQIVRKYHEPNIVYVRGKCLGWFELKIRDTLDSIKSLEWRVESIIMEGVRARIPVNNVLNVSGRVKKKNQTNYTLHPCSVKRTK